jgi:hypothetical protein
MPSFAFQALMFLLTKRKPDKPHQIKNLLFLSTSTFPLSVVFPQNINPSNLFQNPILSNSYFVSENFSLKNCIF